MREAIAVFAEANVEKLQQRLDKTAEKHPDKAADLYLRALEYFTPKLSRSTVEADTIVHIEWSLPRHPLEEARSREHEESTES
jgi:hypothetical protein